MKRTGDMPFVVLIIAVLIAVMVGGLLAEKLGLVGHGDEDTAAKCWPDYQCSITGYPYASAYQVLQMIRDQAYDDFGGGSPTITQKSTFDKVAKALVQCASDLNNFDHNNQTGNLAHCNWLRQVWNTAAGADNDAEWLAVAAELETGH